MLWAAWIGPSAPAREGNGLCAGGGGRWVGTCGLSSQAWSTCGGSLGSLEGRVDVGRWVCRLLTHAISRGWWLFPCLATEAETRLAWVVKHFNVISTLILT